MHYCTTFEQFVYISKSKVDKWRYNNLNKYADYFVEQWLTPPFDNWQLFRRPAGYAPTNGCEPINKRVKQDYLPDGKRLHIIDAFLMLEKLILKYSTDRAKFNFYPTMITGDMKKKVVEKSKKITKEQFFPAELNAIWYKNSDQWYKIWLVPYYCGCSYFLDLHYCHHILAIIRLNIAKIILDSTYVAPAEPRKLVARVNKRNRPAKITGKALERIANTK